MRVCYFGTYDQQYPRNRIIIEGLQANGVQVDECHIPLWRDTEDKIAAASGGWSRIRFLARVLGSYARLISQHGPALRQYDLVMLGYSGQIDTLIAKPLARLVGKPVVLDLFVSIFLAATERGLKAAHPRTVGAIHWLEERACELADLLFLDTAAYADFIHETYGTNREKLKTIPLGANERIFFPVPCDIPDKPFQVLYFGKYIPLHGISTILDAANLLKGERNVQFRMHGKGQLKASAVAQAEALDLQNVTFTDWVADPTKLSEEFAPYEVCLGAFGDTAAARMTIQNKIYEGMAMRKVVITRDTPTARSTFNDGEHLVLCPHGDPGALAEAIIKLRDDPERCRYIAENGYRIFTAHYTTCAVGRVAKQHLEELLGYAS